MSSRFIAIAALALVACNKTPEPQPEPAPAPVATQAAAASTGGGKKDDEPGSAPKTDDKPKEPGKPGGDPHNGSFTLAEATKDLKGAGPIVATIDTSKGKFQCKLFDDKAPITVANFIGLATGKRAWKDSRSGTWVTRPAYDGTTFHRIIKGFMIQGGDPLGNGTGEPGYVIKDEIWEGAKHDRAGLLCMANRGNNTNGAQFFITDAAAAHLDNNYTIFGECGPEQLVHDIASVPLAGERPVTPVKINSVTITRDEKKK
ncbi:MAG: peptidylprolyl isomerase [Labilithrix sp.]|nr:peptidylprolyl isomerase [Labilithrix sp.]MCW5812441.1 peptidylprolyl isomerase [Labilithrix sp.]